MWKEEFWSFWTGDLETFSLFCSYKVSICLILSLIVEFVITSSLLLSLVPSILDFSCNSCHPSKLFTILSSVPLPFSSPSLPQLEPNLCRADDAAAGGDNNVQKWKMYSIKNSLKWNVQYCDSLKRSLSRPFHCSTQNIMVFILNKGIEAERERKIYCRLLTLEILSSHALASIETLWDIV